MPGVTSAHPADQVAPVVDLLQADPGSGVRGIPHRSVAGVDTDVAEIRGEDQVPRTQLRTRDARRGVLLVGRARQSLPEPAVDVAGETAAVEGPGPGRAEHVRLAA